MPAWRAISADALAGVAQRARARACCSVTSMRDAEDAARPARARDRRRRASRPSGRCRRGAGCGTRSPCRPVAAAPGRRGSRADALAVVGMDALGAATRRSVGSRGGVEAVEDARTSARSSRSRPGRSRSSRCRCRRRAMRRRAGAPAPRRWRRCSTRSVTSSATPTKAIGSPACVALDDAARQHVAPAAVGAPVARLHVGRLVGRRAPARPRRATSGRSSGWMNERTSSIDKPSGRGAMPSSWKARSL